MIDIAAIRAEVDQEMAPRRAAWQREEQQARTAFPLESDGLTKTASSLPHRLNPDDYAPEYRAMIEDQNALDDWADKQFIIWL